MKIFFLICAAFGLCVFGGSSQLFGRTTTDVTATVQFSDGQTATVTDFSDQIGIRSTELINITVQFPAAYGGLPVVIEALDGGSTSFGGSTPVSNPDGSINFDFLATAKPGRNSIRVRIGLTSVRLLLWVMDSANPRNNPPNLTAVSNG